MFLTIPNPLTGYKNQNNALIECCKEPVCSKNLVLITFIEVSASLKSYTEARKAMPITTTTI